MDYSINELEMGMRMKKKWESKCGKYKGDTIHKNVQ